MAASARSMVDWKHYVKTYPWVCLGRRSRWVSDRSQAIQGDMPGLATLTEPARTGHLVGKPASAATHGLIDALLATVANIAVQRATAYLGQSMGRLLGKTNQCETSRHDSICTPESSKDALADHHLGLTMTNGSTWPETDYPRVSILSSRLSPDSQVSAWGRHYPSESP